MNRSGDALVCLKAAREPGRQERRDEVARLAFGLALQLLRPVNANLRSYIRENNDYDGCRVFNCLPGKEVP